MTIWFKPPLHDARRSVDLVRLTVAVVLFAHPAHALIHPDDAQALAAGLAQRGVPFALGVAWAALATLLVSALALLARRTALVGAVGSLVVLAGGIIFLYAPRWFVV